MYCKAVIYGVWSLEVWRDMCRLSQAWTRVRSPATSSQSSNRNQAIISRSNNYVPTFLNFLYPISKLIEET